MKMIYEGLSEAGSREENQDCIFCASGSRSGVFLVADGMGGHQDGALASRCIRSKIKKAWENLQNEGAGQMLFQEALEEANAVIRSLTPKGGVCGSTAVVLLISGSRYELYCCGDSHAYLLEKTLFGSKVKLISTDDVWENDPMNVAGMKAQEIRAHKNYGSLLRAVGTQEHFHCHTRSAKLKPGSLFALTSDGIYKYIDAFVFERELREALKKGGKGLAECIEHLKKLAYDAGAPDNLSVILVYLEKE